MPHRGRNAYGSALERLKKTANRSGLRRAIAAALVCVLCCCALPGDVGADGETVTANGHVYLRKGAGTNYDTILVLKPNAELTVKGTSGDWYKVAYGRKSGYVRKDVVTLKGAQASNAQSPASTSAAAYRTLKQGMSGDDVFKLQEGLIYAGYFDMMPDGKYGEGTKTAVTNYQKGNNLKADGVAGEETQRKLLGDPGSAVNTAVSTSTSVSAGQQTADAATTLVYTEATAGSALRLGTKGDLVRQLQTQLQSLGFLTSKPDGSFGLNTEQAVMAFQSANKLKADGVVGEATQKAITTALAAASASTSTSASASDTVLKEGSKSDAVKQMQTALKNLGYYGGVISGSFGQLTGEAVKAFQRANKLEADGIAGATTLNKLYSGSAVAYNGKTSSTGSSGSSTATTSGGPSAASVQHTGISTIRSRYKSGTVVTIYDFHTKLTWKCRFYSVGVHADSEPLTSTDTDIMYRAFGNKNTWTPKSVWVTTPDGQTYIASMHNMPHLSGSIKENNFDGHLCIHFPRTMADAEKTGPYAVSHQKEIIKGWDETQRMAGR